MNTAGERPAGFVSVAPERVLDTRPDNRIAYTGDKPAPGQTLTVQLTNVPTNTTAATLNITGTDPTNNGYVTVWPCGTERPNTSTLNLTTGITSPNSVITQLGTDHTICIYTEAGTHLLADLTGYLATGPFTGLTPERILDTRPDNRIAYTGDKPAPGQTLTVQLTNVPTNTTAATLNITGTDPTNNGYVTVWPCGTERPNTSTLNLTTGITSPNSVITQLGTDHTICIYTEAGTHLLADLTGYLATGPFTGLTPERILDTRPDNRIAYTGDKPAPGQTITVQLTNVPTNTTAATLNITGTDPTNNGYVTVWPCGTERPNTSTLNLTTGITSPNSVITQLGTDHTICIYTEAGTHLLADLTGYLR